MILTKIIVFTFLYMRWNVSDKLLLLAQWPLKIGTSLLPARINQCREWMDGSYGHQ